MDRRRGLITSGIILQPKYQTLLTKSTSNGLMRIKVNFICQRDTECNLNHTVQMDVWNILQLRSVTLLCLFRFTIMAPVDIMEELLKRLTSFHMQFMKDFS